MDKQTLQQTQPPTKDSIEVAVRKPRQGKKSKVPFNLKIEVKDIQILFD